jgi:hypothetical protein
MMLQPDDDHVCLWCRKLFTPRRDGGKPQVFCRPACRRDFDAAGRRWVAEAIAAGVLTVGAVKNGAPATRALSGSREQASPLPGTRSLDNALPDPVMRFLVEVPRHTIEAFLEFGWLRGDQRDDLAAIMAALRRLGKVPAVARIA